MTDQPRTLGGRYELGPVIGRGGMAQVRRARDTRLGRDVAVKELRLDLASDSTFQARFRREAQAAAGLNHPNIVAVYDTGEELDAATGIQVPYIVMELVEGRTLRDVLREGRPILPRRALEFTQGVLDALAYSHKAGIVHRDIKPANVMLTNNGMVKVMDFGIARAVADTSSTMTQTAAVIGTAQYLSPEQARGETVDSRSDIYSAGCLMYELLVGRPPFQGDSPVSVAYQHVRETPVPPSQLDDEITPGMDAVVLKSLAKDPADRYQSAGAMRADINRLLNGQSVEAASAFTPTSVITPPPRTPASAASATAVFETTAPQTAVTAVQQSVPPRRRKVWPAVLIGLGIIAAVIAGLLLLYPPNRVEQVMVPAVYNYDQAAAEAALKAAKLTPSVKPLIGPDDSTLNKVVNQNPEPGRQVDINSVVEITVNVGPEKKKVPTGLKGRSLQDAEKLVKAAGLVPRAQAATDEPANAKPNTVLAVRPDEGQEVTADTEVILEYATGKGTVPSVYNLNEAQAKKELERYGFTKVSVEFQESTAKPGTVIGQRPTAGEQVTKDTTIVIILAQAPLTPSTAPADPPSDPPTDPGPTTKPS